MEVVWLEMTCYVSSVRKGIYCSYTLGPNQEVIHPTQGTVVKLNAVVCSCFSIGQRRAKCRPPNERAGITWPWERCCSSVSSSGQVLKKIAKYIQEQNDKIYAPRGLLLTDPIERGLRVVSFQCCGVLAAVSTASELVVTTTTLGKIRAVPSPTAVS